MIGQYRLHDGSIGNEYQALVEVLAVWTARRWEATYHIQEVSKRLKELTMPVTKENLRETMSYHQLDPKQKDDYARIQEAAITMAEVALDVLPPCGDQQAAIRLIFEAKATLNRGVAVRGIV